MAGEKGGEGMRNRQKATEQYLKQHRVIDLSIVFTKWNDFIYLYVPNNWLKMHGYPMRKRRI